MNEYIKGDIVYCQLNNTGYVQSGLRPCIIVSNNQNNRFSPTIQVIPLTSSKSKHKLPVHVEVDSTPKPSIALAEQFTTINKTDILKKYGSVTK